MRKVWAEFEVKDELEPSDVALVLELRFGGEGNTATVWDANPLREPLEKAECFIEGFEGDEVQESIDELLGEIREALA